MVADNTIRIWMGNDLPVGIRLAVDQFAHDAGVIVVFVAHVPAALVANEMYRRCNPAGSLEGWMREGECGLFGINALDTISHPDGNGDLLVGSCV